MISIFNGRSRGLGEDETKSAVYAQVSVELREHLYLFPHSDLPVFLNIALHTNADGWADPSREGISRDTGLNIQTISASITRLSALTVKGHRVMLVGQQPGHRGTFGRNAYLIFPTTEEVKKYETDRVRFNRTRSNRVRPDRVRPDRVRPDRTQRTTNPKKNQSKGKPVQQQQPTGAHFDAVAAALSGYEIKGKKAAEVAAYLSAREDGARIVRLICETWRLNADIRAGSKAEIANWRGMAIHALLAFDVNGPPVADGDVTGALEKIREDAARADGAAQKNAMARGKSIRRQPSRLAQVEDSTPEERAEAERCAREQIAQRISSMTDAERAEKIAELREWIEKRRRHMEKTPADARTCLSQIESFEREIVEIREAGGNRE